MDNQMEEAYPKGTNWALIFTVFGLVTFWVVVYQAYQHWHAIIHFFAPAL